MGGGTDDKRHISTRNSDGNRLNLGNFDEHGLNCNDNWWDENRNSNMGVFPLMVCEIQKTKFRLRLFNLSYLVVYIFLTNYLSFFLYQPVFLIIVYTWCDSVSLSPIML